MTEIELIYETPPDSMPVLRVNGITLDDTCRQRIKAELDSKYHDFIHEVTGIYRLATTLPYGLNRIDFRFERQTNPESNRDPIIVLRGEMPNKSHQRSSRTAPTTASM